MILEHTRIKEIYSYPRRSKNRVTKYGVENGGDKIVLSATALVINSENK
jgi:hypothetical protein